MQGPIYSFINLYSIHHCVYWIAGVAGYSSILTAGTALQSSAYLWVNLTYENEGLFDKVSRKAEKGNV